MGFVIIGVSLICSLASLVCWILTVVKAFQNESAVSGILSLCPLVAFILGWMNVNKWQHNPVMAIWSVCIVINIILNVIAGAMQAGAQ